MIFIKTEIHINVPFSFTLIKEEVIKEEEAYNNTYIITFLFYDVSTNIRAFKNPALIDNKDLEMFIMDCLNEKIIVKLKALRSDSAWKFYEFLYIRFDVYKLNSAIGKINKLPQHF